MTLSLAQYDVLEFIKKFGRTSSVNFNGNVVKALLRRGLLEYDESNYLILTEAGHREAV